jgi:hypothetical protein
MTHGATPLKALANPSHFVEAIQGLCTMKVLQKFGAFVTCTAKLCMVEFLVLWTFERNMTWLFPG